MTSVNVYLVDQDASSFYRLAAPAKALRDQGADVQLCRTGEETRDADVFVFNRPIRPTQADVVESLVNAGKRVVVDLDDDFDHVPVGHQMYGRLDPEHLHRACRAATAVTVSTPALDAIYGYGKGVVVPNFVPAWYLDIESTHANPWPTVLWYGTMSSHPHDLQTTERGIAKALVDTGGGMTYIGPQQEADFVRWALKLTRAGIRFHCTGWYTNKTHLFHAIAAADLGIVPLADNTFNAAKSWLKGLEFAATGVAFIASPRPEYQRLHNLGAGLLAKYGNTWHRTAARLLSDQDYRAEIAGKGREAASQLTIERNCGQFHDAWAGR